MSLSSFSVRRGVTVSLFYLLIVGYGIFEYARMPRDLFPDITFPMVVVATQYSGAGPEDVEKLITRPIESAVASTEGVKEVTSTSRYGISLVMVEFNWGTNMFEAEVNVRKNIDLFVWNLPTEAQKPITFALNPSMQPVVFLGVTGPYGPARLRKIAEDLVEPRLERIAGVAAASTNGGLKREIQVDLNPERLRALSVAPQQVVDAIRLANLQLPGGSIRQGGELLSIKTQGRFISVDEIAEVIIQKRVGREIRVKDVAAVRDWFEDETQVIRANGQGSVMTMVRKASSANSLLVAKKVLAALPKIEKELPEGMKLQVYFAQSEIIERSLSNVLNTTWQGVIWTALVLFFFLYSVTASAVVSLAIPVSLMVTFPVMKLLGVSMNSISMTGLALGIGMLVDNSIVVLENIYRHVEMGKPPAQAATDAAAEVAMPVTASTMTNLAVFIPILFVPGIAGAIFKDMVITICVSQTASLIVAITLIPLAASRMLRKRAMGLRPGPLARMGERMRRATDRLGDGYAWVLGGVLRFRKTALLVALGLFGFAIYLFTVIGTDFLSKTDQGQIELSITSASSNNLQSFQKMVRDVEAIVKRDVPETRLFSADLGSASGIGAVFGSGEYAGRLRIRLPPLQSSFMGIKTGGTRVRKQMVIEDELRKKLADLPGLEIKPAVFSLTGSAGDLELFVYLDDLATARRLGLDLKERLLKLKGVADVTFNLEETSPEVKIDLNRPRLSQLGTNPGLVTSAISTYFMGSLAGTYLEKGDEYYIRVRAPAEVRNDVERLKNAPIFLATGAQMPLASVASVSDSIGPTKVSRKGQRRVLSIAVTKTNAAALGDLTKRVEAELKQVQWPEEAIYTVGGSAQDMKESFMYLGFAFMAALVLVYMVMASQFESLLEPFVILFTVPMAAIGVAAALYLTKTTISVTAAIGIVMLAGIVVNNAIVLIDFIKQEWDQRWESLIEITIRAGRTRLRPILMTTLTTILALLPLALGIGEGAETWAPMAITVMGGLITSTLLTLFVIPCWYVLIAGTLARRRERKETKLRERIASQQGLPVVG